MNSLVTAARFALENDAGGIRDERVLGAIATVPRHLFMEPGLASQAYEDAALPIGHQQTSSKPSVVAATARSRSPAGDSGVAPVISTQSPGRPPRPTRPLS